MIQPHLCHKTIQNKKLGTNTKKNIRSISFQDKTKRWVCVTVAIMNIFIVCIVSTLYYVCVFLLQAIFLKL